MSLLGAKAYVCVARRIPSLQVWAQQWVGRQEGEMCNCAEMASLSSGSGWVDSGSGSEGRVTERGGIALPQASHGWCDLANAVRRRKGVISCCGSPVGARFQVFGCCKRQTALRRRFWVWWPACGVQEWRPASSIVCRLEGTTPIASRPSMAGRRRQRRPRRQDACSKQMANRRVGTAPFLHRLLASGTGGDMLRAANNCTSSSFGREFIEAFRA